MLWLKRVLVLIFFIAVFLLGLTFLTANEYPTELNFFVFDYSTTSGGAFVFGAIFGLLATMIATYPIIIAYKFKLNRAQKVI